MPSSKPFIVAVDGPAGSGKSSVCAHACERLHWTYVNTGFLYRAVGVVARQNQVDMTNMHDIQAVAAQLNKQLNWNPETREVWIDQQNITPLLSTEQAGLDASYVATLGVVREALLPLQRRLTLMAKDGAIVDGRDIGTVVFPDAPLKVFLTASLEKRAERRFEQLRYKGQAFDAMDLEKIKLDIAQRDAQDGGRDIAPLKQAPDAILLDTSHLDVEQSIQALVKIVQTYLSKR